MDIYRLGCQSTGCSPRMWEFRLRTLWLYWMTTMITLPLSAVSRGQLRAWRSRGSVLQERERPGNVRDSCRERNGFNRKPHLSIDTEVGLYKCSRMFPQRTGTLDVLATESNARFGCFGQAGVGSWSPKSLKARFHVRMSYARPARKSCLTFMVESNFEFPYWTCRINGNSMQRI